MAAQQSQQCPWQVWQAPPAVALANGAGAAAPNAANVARSAAFLEWHDNAAVRCRSDQWGGKWNFCLACGSWKYENHVNKTHHRKMESWGDYDVEQKMGWTLDYITKPEARHAREVLDGIFNGENQEIKDFWQEAVDAHQTRVAMQARAWQPGPGMAGGYAAPMPPAGRPPLPPPPGPPAGLGSLAELTARVRQLELRVEELEKKAEEEEY